MNEFLLFFEDLKSWEKAAWILACLTFSWVLEAVIPLFKKGYKKWKHAGVNFVFLVAVMLINIGFGFLTVSGFNWASDVEFGLLYLTDLPLWLELLIAVLIMDLVAQYFVHFLLHKVKFMWKMHMVHHSDTNVDATTGTRHHPGDYIIRETFAFAAVIIAGAPLSFYLFYRIATIFFTYMPTPIYRCRCGWIKRFLLYLYRQTCINFIITLNGLGQTAITVTFLVYGIGCLEHLFTDAQMR